ncbi:MAG: amino acid permease [Bacteroidota bacterium]|nr:amino acid permease [Bacteroidota bacterium]MDP4190137.1 amino acid permease [Bacteroidota bacterium]MDP4196682.1 amino acid permease [Bacteroidota bacterium]
MKQLFAKKPLSLLLEEMKGENRLRRILGPVALTSLGVGAIIGTGIFVLTGVAAHDKAGPAIILSFVVSGMACVFAALCYAEFASMVPVAGSAYTYAYATLGELFAWIIGWDLVLEYAVASATVAHGWSHYFQDFIGIFGFKLPHSLTRAPFDFDPSSGLLASTGTAIDFPAIIIAALITAILVKGIRESAGFNAAMVILKLVIVLFVIVVGAMYINTENWTKNFAPYGFTGVSLFGKTIFGQTGLGGAPVGMLAAAATIFFAYIGFDSISTHAEEAKNPKRDVPIGIITSLLVCTILYIAVAAIITGIVPYDKIDIDAPVSNAFKQIGLPWAQLIISFGALAGITSVLLVMMLSQPRIFLAMARDGLIPKEFFGAVHEKFRTPWKSTILTGCFVAVLAGLLPLRILAELVNIGTLFAFVIVCAAVLIMRRTHPEAERPFRSPWVPFIPIMGILTCLMLMFSLPEENWLRLFVWLAIGFVIYFGYGRKHSVMHEKITSGEYVLENNNKK